MGLDAKFYWDVAKFAFCLIGGGAAGYFAAKSTDGALTEVGNVIKMKVAERALAITGKGTDEFQVITDETAQ